MSFKATEVQSAFEVLNADERKHTREVSRKATIVLEWLLLGGALEFQGYVVRMFDGRLCVEANTERYEGGKVVASAPTILGMPDLTLETFLSECEKTSDEDIGVIAMNLGLNRGRDKGR